MFVFNLNEWSFFACLEQINGKYDTYSSHNQWRGRISTTTPMWSISTFENELLSTLKWEITLQSCELSIKWWYAFKVIWTWIKQVRVNTKVIWTWNVLNGCFHIGKTWEVCLRSTSLKTAFSTQPIIKASYWGLVYILFK